jgi:hypothetical protein
VFFTLQVGKSPVHHDSHLHRHHGNGVSVGQNGLEPAVQFDYDALDGGSVRDSDSDLSALVAPLSRLLGCIAEGRDTRQLGLRVGVVLYSLRADLIGGRTLREISGGTTRQNTSKLLIDFRATFHLKPSPQQVAKRSKAVDASPLA